ncbi:MAG: DUF6263 family protein [Planctomycetota bacterium]|nr:DUF6263 family protein [Planctomycetota bacterium]
MLQASMTVCRWFAIGVVAAGCALAPAQNAAKPATPAKKAAAEPAKQEKAGATPLAWIFRKGDVIAYEVRWTSVEGESGAKDAHAAAAFSGRVELSVLEAASDRGVVGVTMKDAQGSWSEPPAGWTPKGLGAIGEADPMFAGVRVLGGEGVASTLSAAGEAMSVDGYAGKFTALKSTPNESERTHASVHTLGENDEDVRVLLSAIAHVAPAAGVAPGATWTVVQERAISGAGTLKQELTLTLKSIGADRIAQIAIVGKATLLDAASTELGKAELRESSITGDAKFDVVAGRVTQMNRSATFKIALPPAVGSAAGVAGEVMELRQSLSAVLNTAATKAGGESVAQTDGAMHGDAAAATTADTKGDSAVTDGPDFVKQPGDLEWGWTEGETMRYRVTYSNSTSMKGLGDGANQNSQKVVIDVSVVVEKVGEDKAATATLSFDRARVSMNMPMAGESVFDTADPENVPPMMAMFARPIQVMMKKPIKIDVNRSGAIKALTGFAKLADQFIDAMPQEFGDNEEMKAQMKSQMTDELMRSMLEPFLRILPEKPVKKGETWVIPGRKGPGEAEPSPPTTYVFDDVQEVDGVRCAYVSTRTPGRNQNAGGEGGPQFQFKQSDTTGKFIFIIELGKVLNAETKSSMSYGGDLPGQDEEGFQREYSSVTTQTMSIELVE